MKRFNKIYIEISNICNLSCSFCHGTKRPPKAMSLSEFNLILDKIKPYTDYIYYHVLGEPLLHKDLPFMLKSASDKGFKSCITTNGSLLAEKGRLIADAVLSGNNIHKISISLQAQEANETLLSLESYMRDCCLFSQRINRIDFSNTIISFRLWNGGGLNSNNDKILNILHEYYPGEWKEHQKGYTIGDRTYLEFDNTFSWPDLEKEERRSERFFCYGLKDQLGILSDGTVVPCCLDAEGTIALGNIFAESLEAILKNERTSSIYDGFKEGRAVEELCRKCGYASRFAK